jgi:hypothetical protein
MPWHFLIQRSKMMMEFELRTLLFLIHFVNFFSFISIFAWGERLRSSSKGLLRGSAERVIKIYWELKLKVERRKTKKVRGKGQTTKIKGNKMRAKKCQKWISSKRKKSVNQKTRIKRGQKQIHEKN